MSRYDAVLFDMDGTLLDTADDIAAALNQTLSEFGYPTHGRDAVIRFIGSGAYRLMERALPAHTDSAEIERILSAYRERYRQHISERTRPFPGVLPMLSALDEAGLKLAIISNKGDANVKRLAKEHFGSLIHTAVGASDTVPLKPDPDMLQTAMRHLGVEPEHTLYIGDAPTDYYAAQNADTDCILARWGYGDPRAMSPLLPLYFAGDPAELPMLILQEQEGSS
ncbi:MAG: HAD-IA family hydrolase [Clostridiales bacterium]|nr:HAD-IA family hydrolase [Clostridiales bacterium]